jgi:putative toxin-antitoxin system antitoxin component (TIGR02293 family)
MTAVSIRPASTARPLLPHVALAASDMPELFDYDPRQGVDTYIRQVHGADPLQIVEIERQGVPGAFITELARRMELPASRLLGMLRIPKATALRKTAGDAMIDGRAGLAAVGLVRLLGLAQEIVRDSTAPEAQDFDTVKWLGRWIERPQPALGGRRPAELLDTPTGVSLVAQVLGALQSGAYL